MQVGRYRLDALIGQGGMGAVYRAVDTRLQRQVAIKFLGDDPFSASARERFEREAKAASALNHPHILTIHDTGEAAGRQFLVMELVDGGTLRDWARARPRSWNEVADLMIGVADGLAAAHAAGIIHRDIKPENILIARNGQAKLTDFGIAKLIEPFDGDAPTEPVAIHRTRQGAILGTLAYMAPDQADGAPADPRSDIFSLGVVLYELLAGRHPFEGATGLEVLERIRHQRPAPLNPAIPAALRSIVEKAMEKKADDRYQSLPEMVVDLRRAVRSSVDRPIPAPARVHRYRLLMAAVAAVIMIGALWQVWSRRGGAPLPATAPPPITSIAVLPFQNLSSDPDQVFFSDGTTEALITKLAQIHALAVTSRTSVMRYKDKPPQIQQIGRELGVDAIVEGSVQRAGARVRVTAQLIRASTDTHIWSKDFDRDLKDVLDLQNELALAIAEEIRIRITPEETHQLAASRPVKPDAYDAYLLGWFHAWKDGGAELKQAIAQFERAIALEPEYAEAYAGSSVARTWLRNVDPTTDLGPGRLAAAKALALAPSLSEAHSAMAFIHLADWDWTAAEREFQRALELNPNSLAACGCYPYVLAAWGRDAEALPMIEHARKLNPLSSDIEEGYAFVSYYGRRYDAALQHAARALELDVRIGARITAALASIKLGKWQDARAQLDHPELRESATMGYLDALQGKPAEARKIADALIASRKELPGVALIFFALGDKARGFSWLARAVNERDPGTPFVLAAPQFDDVRADPRFQTQFARLKLPSR